jgi:hypothetical protein
VIQSLFLRGRINGKYFDSTGDDNLKAWLRHIADISPKSVMIYPIDRATPLEGLEKIKPEELNRIAQKVNELGIKTEVFY